MLDDSGPLVFLHRPIALVFFAFGFLAIFLRIRQILRHRRERLVTGSLDERRAGIRIPRGK